MKGVGSEGVVIRLVTSTGDWYSTPLGTREVPCGMHLIIVPPGVKSLAIYPLPAVFFAVTPSPEPSVPLRF